MHDANETSSRPNSHPERTPSAAAPTAGSTTDAAPPPTQSAPTQARHGSPGARHAGATSAPTPRPFLEQASTTWSRTPAALISPPGKSHRAK